MTTPESIHAPKGLQLLLVEDDPDHTVLIRGRLRGLRGTRVQVDCVESLKDAREQMRRKRHDAVLLDLNLPDSPLEDFASLLSKLGEEAPDVPVIVLTAVDDVQIGMEAVHRGAQDYLVKIDLTNDLLERSIHYAIERKRQAVELKRSNQELENFAHVVSHELKTPLSVVSYSLELLKRSVPDLDEQGLKFISNASGAVASMAQLISDLLEYASAGATAKGLTLVNSRDALERAVENLRVAVEETGARLSHDDLPHVLFDESQLRQLFQNLVGNAIKYRSDAPPEIHVEARRDDGRWIFAVRDNGIGIEPQHAEKVFGIFERLSPQDDRGGTGIGLALCKRIVERNGGRIWVESEPGRGSTFYFTVPAAP